MTCCNPENRCYPVDSCPWKRALTNYISSDFYVCHTFYLTAAQTSGSCFVSFRKPVELRTRPQATYSHIVKFLPWNSDKIDRNRRSCKVSKPEQFRSDEAGWPVLWLERKRFPSVVAVLIGGERARWSATSWCLSWEVNMADLTT